VIFVHAETFDPGERLNAFTKDHTDMGAVVSFTGHVRDNANQAGNMSDVSTLYLEHYPGFTETQISKIEHQAHTRWPGIRTLIIHRYGDLCPGDPIVFVAVASAHRKTAFEAATFLMDYLKTDAPFWKKENRTGGAFWIEPKDTDRQARKNWQETS